jgi:HD superfamily phosphohydrolase
MPTLKPQRIRDPVHNLIPFGTEQFEHTLWQVIQTPPFQRLRRIRQLGFAEFVFPGATHTRFAHSIGVFHTARQLMRVIHDHIRADRTRQFGEHQAQVALAASLVHDVGHGMFSHAFEAVGKDLNLPMARHEAVSERLIRDSEIAGALNRTLGGGFANDVATLIGRKEPGNLYDAVVSSQFDADRLDYMQRDRLMTGVQSSGIDLTWLLANLEIASVRTGADEERTGEVETLVLGPKAALTAESYVLSLFHLYPNVYFHKTTRAAEAVFGALMRRLIRLVREGHTGKVGLTANHPIARFAQAPERLEHATALDDLVFWGALPMLAEAEDQVTAGRATALRDRRLPECIDIRGMVEASLVRRTDEARASHRARLDLACANIVKTLRDWLGGLPDGAEPVLIDRQSRSPYKRYQDSDTPLNRILIQPAGMPVTDMAELSPVIAGAEPFEICRAYVARGDSKARLQVENTTRTEIERTTDGNP